MVYFLGYLVVATSSGTLLISHGFKIRNGLLKFWRTNSLHVKSNEFGKSYDHTCAIIHVRENNNTSFLKKGIYFVHM